MNRSLLYPALPLLALLLTAPAANAAQFIYQGALLGANEVPPVATSGTGVATVRYDDTAHTLQVDATFSGLTGTTSAAHIHVAPSPGANGPVATQVPSFVGFPLGVMAGTYSRVFDLTDAASWNPDFITSSGGTAATAEAALAAALAAGRAYFNVHSSVYPGGEIRANLVAIPEPAGWAMMIAGFGLTGAMLRRRPRMRFVPA